MRFLRVLLFGAAATLLSAPTYAQDNSVRIGGKSGPPDVYIIQPGDTLWDISMKFLGNPYYWPRLWSINDYVTNPHWIYPGNRIVFRPGTLLDPPGIGIGGPTGRLAYDIMAPECGPDVNFSNSYPTAVFTSPGFIADKADVEIFGEVFAAKRNQLNLAEGDRIYMELEDDNAVECGDVLAVYRKQQKVRHPDRWLSKYGNMYDVLAEVTVVHTNDEVATGVVRTSYQPFDRGDVVGPLVQVKTELAVDAPRGDLEGMVIAQLNKEVRMNYPGETVFVDVGRSDGVKVGNTFYVVHRNDPTNTKKQWDTKIPMQVQGRVVVTRVDEEHSTAVIVDAAVPIYVGDHLVMDVE